MAHLTPRRVQRRIALGALGCVIAQSSGAVAAFEPNTAHQLEPGPAIGWAELTCNQAGVSPVLLPTATAVQWRTQVTAGLASGPATDGEGHVILATVEGTLLELDRRGRRLWERRLEAVAASHPAVGADGARAVITRSGHFHRFETDGSRAGVARLPCSIGGREVRLLPQRDCSYVAAAGTDLFWLEPHGELRAQTKLPSPASRLFLERRGVTVATQRGSLWTWRGIAKARLRTTRSFDVIAHAGDGTYVAASGSRVSRGAPNHLTAPAAELAGNSRVLELAALGDDRLAMRLAPDLLILTEDGVEVARHLLTAGLQSSNFGLLVDAKGAAMMMSVSGRLVLLDSHGRLQRAEHPLAPSALGLVPTAPGQVVVATAAGLVFEIGTPESTPPSR